MMRPFEILLVSALAVTLVIVTIPWFRGLRWRRFLPTLPLIALLFQVSVEGCRWQMVPVYVLSGIVFLATLPSLIRGYPLTGKTRRISVALAIVFSLVGLVVIWITVELAVQLPVFRMPLPSGPYQVGTQTFLLVDQSRTDDDSPLDNGYRSLSIQAWYPAELSGTEERTTYLSKDIRHAMEQLGGPPRWYLSHLDQIPTYAHRDANIAHTAERFPVVIYSPSGNASLHKVLFEELASRGYVVVSVSHPHWNNVLFDANGQVILQDEADDRYQAWFREENSPAVQDAKAQILAGNTIIDLEEAQKALNRARPVAIAELREWSADVGFVLDQLAEMNSPAGFFDGQLDLNQTGVMGFSLGGANAGQFCVQDSRCRAGINLDGFMFGDILDDDLKVPFMFIHSQNPDIKPGRVGTLFYERAEESAYMVQVAGASHGDLGAPAPNGRPIIVQTGIGLTQFPDGAYLARIINAYVLAFFDKHLGNKAAPLLDGPSPYPEVLFMNKEGR